MPHYIRFIVQSDHESQTQCTGVVTSLRMLAEKGRLPSYQVEYSQMIFQRINDGLPCPPFSANNWSDCVCWFKDSAKDWISVFHEMVAILEDSDFRVAYLTTESPGNIVYEDEFQIVAKSSKY